MNRLWRKSTTGPTLSAAVSLAAAVSLLLVGCQTSVCPPIGTYVADCAGYVQPPAGCAAMVQTQPLAVVAPTPPPVAAPPVPPGVVVTPRRIVAPVGSEVIMLAEVRGTGGRPLTGRQVQWMLTPESAGQLMTLGQDKSCFLLAGFDHHRGGEKISNTYAIGKTASRGRVIARPPSPAGGSVTVQAGQSPMGVTSPTEGTSHVTAYVAQSDGWEQRHDTATIHWVDAQFSFPAPAVRASGERHVLTTTVTRHTDGSPLAGWIVRYEVADGPPSGFGPDFSSGAEVTTDAAGQASVEFGQQAPQPGTNRINIQVLRPADPAAGVSQPFIAGNGATQVTFNSPNVAINVAGPSVSSVGATASFRLEVSNIGDAPASDVVVTDEMPPGMSFLGSDPTPELVEGRHVWRLGEIDPGQSRVIQIETRTTAVGTLNYCCGVTTSSGLTARGCAATTVAEAAPAGQARIEIAVTGRDRAQVGEDVAYTIVVRNVGDAEATGLRISDYFDEGLKHAVATSPIRRRELVSLQPKDETSVKVTFRVEKAGPLSHRVEVEQGGRVLAQRQVVLNATAAATGPSPVQPAGGSLSLTITPPASAIVGGSGICQIEVRNTGATPLQNVSVRVQEDTPLKPLGATGKDLANPDDPTGLNWIVPQLGVGATVVKKVEYQFLRAVPSACIHATFSAQGVASGAARECFPIVAMGAQKVPSEPMSLAGDADQRAAADQGSAEGDSSEGPRLDSPTPAERQPPADEPIPSATDRPAPSGDSAASSSAAADPAIATPLDVQIAERTNPVAVGSQCVYEIALKNTSRRSLRGVRVSARVPDEMTLKGHTGPIRALAKDAVVRYEPIAEIRPNEVIRLTITLVAAKATDAAQFEVDVRSDQLARPIARSKSTRIFDDR